METIKIRTEINETEQKDNRINDIENWFFEKISKLRNVQSQ